MSICSLFISCISNPNQTHLLTFVQKYPTKVASLSYTDKQIMENLHRKNLSGEAFSFPSTPSPSHEYHNHQKHNSNFEFGCITPDSPTINQDSPADRLFFNGKLLPHSFPFHPISNNIYINNIVMDNSRTTSRTSSISSKDSFMSSRSNSTNSRSSTSSSDNSTRNLLHQRRPRIVGNKSCTSNVASKVYGSSQRWQIVTPLPYLSRETSRRNRSGKENVNVINEKVIRKKKQVRVGKKIVMVKPIRLGLRFLKWFMSSCRECHAIEPSRKGKVKPGNVKVQ